MEYLKINPTQILKKYTTSRDFGYNCFDILDKNIPIQVFYAYFNHIVEYKLKNIWNHIILQWITMQNTMESKNRKDYLKSIYSKQKYTHIHTKINDTQMNDKLNEFINNDTFKAMFAILCIQKHII